MKTAELNKICRTCLSDNIDLQSLFHDTVSDMIMACSEVQVKFIKYRLVKVNYNLLN